MVTDQFIVATEQFSPVWPFARQEPANERARHRNHLVRSPWPTRRVAMSRKASLSPELSEPHSTYFNRLHVFFVHTMIQTQDIGTFLSQEHLAKNDATKNTPVSLHTQSFSSVRMCVSSTQLAKFLALALPAVALRCSNTWISSVQVQPRTSS